MTVNISKRSQLISRFFCLQDEPYLLAEIKALNTTDPPVGDYFINDELHFSWIVKHAINGSYETATDVNISFSFPPSVNIKTINASGIVRGSITRNPGTLIFTPTVDSLPLGTYT